MTQIWTVNTGSLVRRGYSQGDNFTLGDTKPNSGNTGVPSGTVLTTSSGGPITYATAGQAIENVRFERYVFVDAPNVTFRNCEFVGPTSASFVSNAYGVLNCRSSNATNTLVERCSMHPQNAAYASPGMFWLNGVSVRANATVTIRRCDIYHVVDGVNASAGPSETGYVVLEGNYIHDLAFMNNSADQASSTPPYWTHNDGVQLQGGSNHQIVGNYFESYLAPLAGVPSGNTTTLAGYDDGTHGVPSARNAWSAGLTISPNNSLVTNISISKNWFEGGTASFQFNSLNYGGASGNVGYFGGNRFGMDQYDYNSSPTVLDQYQIRYKSGLSFTGLTTNYFDPDAPSVPVEKQGVLFSQGFSGGIRVDP